jgi:hypothetical protein
MTCAPTDRLLQTIKVHAPGATDAIINLELFNVMDEFFRRTSSWHHLSDIVLAEGMVEYGFNLPVNTQVVRMLGVTHNDFPVPSASSVGHVQTSIGTIEPQATFPDGDASVAWDRSDMESNIFSYAIYRPDYISLTSAPDDEARKYPLQLLVTLTLARGCLECECDDWAVEEWMWDMYFQDWTDGVLGRLYGMPAKPWASPTHAAYHAKRFRNAMAYRKQESLRGFTYGQPLAPLFPKGGWT